MRIGIDARIMQKGLGLGRYVERLITHLQEIDTQNEYIVFLNDANWDHFTPTSNRWKKVRANIKWYSFAEQIIFPRIIARQKVDLMHFPHINVPLFYRKPFVVTIHDLILIKHPASATSAASTRSPLVHKIKYLGYRAVLRYASRHARTIITVTEYVKRDIMNVLGIPGDRIKVTHESADLEVVSGETLPAAVHKPYLFYVGSSYPHKNISLLLEAMTEMKKEGSSLVLVLAGQEDYFQKKLAEQISAQFINGEVVHLGCVDDKTLALLYTESFAHVFPSLEEGFGLPALEAMGYGTPVIASNSSCLPEIIDGAGLLFDPMSVAQLIECIKKLQNDPILRALLIQKGKARLAQFSWRRCAEQTLAIYNKL